MTDRQNIEHALQRRAGMDPEKRRELNTAFATADDLRWICPKCGTKYTGSMAEILKQAREGCGHAETGS